MLQKDMTQRSANRPKQYALMVIFALSWVGTGFAWGLAEWQGTSSTVLRIIFALNMVFHPVMGFITWKNLVPFSVVDMTCLFFAVGLCGLCMAMRFYAGEYGASIALEPLYIWIPVLYVFAFTLTNRKRSMIISLGIMFLYLSISLPYLSQNLMEPQSNFIIQTHLVSGILITALYFFSSYQQRLQMAQFTVNELAQRANTDDLTKLANRRRMTEVINHEMLRFSRYGHPFSIIIFDIDHFKQVNDKFGHAVGDKILVALAKCTKEVLREVDTLGRWGGEEFMVILPETTFDEAKQKASSLCRHVAAASFMPQQTITVSCGVTSLTPGDSSEALFQRADVALYVAKRYGRNRAEGVQQNQKELFVTKT